MCETPVPADELADAKHAIVAGFALSLESPPQMLSYYTDNWLYGLPADYWDTYPARISAVPAADVQAVARKYRYPSRLQIVAVGDADQDRGRAEEKGRARDVRRGRQSDEVTAALLREPVRRHPLDR